MLPRECSAEVHPNDEPIVSTVHDALMGNDVVEVKKKMPGEESMSID